ncbi:hypothetical protein OHT93_37660 [Streptomyces sp. NBC_00191]|uniref:hypothetical protein n=1 Tax=Streptomyces sp. NBC_00191 TaxID=2975674 RepID=UPI003243F250
MKAGLGSVITAAANATQQAASPRPLHIALSLTVGVLAALVAGVLHRSDRPDPSRASTYSLQAAFMRAGIALFGGACLTLATLMSPHQGVGLLILLMSVVAGVVYGLLAYFDISTLQTSVWKGATMTASAAALGQAVLALYGGS